MGSLRLPPLREGSSKFYFFFESSRSMFLSGTATLLPQSQHFSISHSIL